MLIAFKDSQPLYRQIYEQLRHKVLNGELAPGQKLLSSRELADQLTVSRTSVLQAFEQFTAEGYTYSKVGSGTFVVEALPDATFVDDHRICFAGDVHSTSSLSDTVKTVNRLFEND